MLRRAAIGLLLVTAAALVVAPLSFYVGARHAYQKYTEEIARLHGDLRATQQHQGVYLPPERYSSMVGQLEQQRRDIHQKADHIRNLEQEMQNKEVIFAGLKKALKKKTVKLVNNEEQLCHAKRKLRKPKQPLRPADPALSDERSPLSAQQDQGERRLAADDQPPSDTERPQSDPQAEDGPAGRRTPLGRRNELVGRQFHAQFQTDMARLESALENAFQMQRAFCTQMYANLGAAVERRKHEVASLTSLLSALLGSQTEQLRELEAHAQSEAAGQHSWIGAQLAAIAARRQAQADTLSVLQRQLAAGAEAVLARLAQLDASAEQRQAELRRWLQQHDAGLRAVLDELAELVRRREQQARQEAEERAAALEAENRRLVDRQANLTGRIESLQASLASIGAALAASSATVEQLAAAAAEEGASAESAAADRRALLEETRREETEFYTAAGQRIERARARLVEGTSTLNTLLSQTEKQTTREAGEASTQLERAREAWTPTLAELTAGWDEHSQLQEEALRARSEAVNGGLQHAQKRVQNLASSLHGAVRGSDQLLESQSRGFFASIRERQEELTDECARIETQSAAIGEMVRRRDNEVEVFVLDTLHRDLLLGSTPRQRQLSYQRYRLAAARGRQSDQPASDVIGGNSTQLSDDPADDGLKTAPSPFNVTRLDGRLEDSVSDSKSNNHTSSAPNQGNEHAKHRSKLSRSSAGRHRRRMRRARRRHASRRASRARERGALRSPCLMPPGG
ncbi:paramyosin-like [Amphibalanus amphitrite]|uniref:paramyosin-like n=1 Tax=Amphibalanus amphitrite TaxID=1232801 RepID=UPI001C91DF4C|nr:paramyosin-like [Amphibalanus amphitrite]